MATRKPIQRKDSGVLERHIQSIMLSLTTGAIVFASTYFFNDKSDKAVLNTQLAALTTQVSELRADIKTIQSGQVTRQEFTDHESRIRALEKRNK